MPSTFRVPPPLLAITININNINILLFHSSISSSHRFSNTICLLKIYHGRYQVDGNHPPLYDAMILAIRSLSSCVLILAQLAISS